MRTLLLASLFAALLAPGAQAQSTTARCAQHRETEVRCVGFGVLAEGFTSLHRVSVSNLPAARVGTASMWVSHCGTQGAQAGGPRPLAGTTGDLRFGGVGGVLPGRDICFEFFVTNCGRPCAQVFQNPVSISWEGR